MPGKEFMSCYNPWGETQDWVINWASYGMKAHAKETELRRAVKAITAMLDSQEWAEHISSDEDIKQLEQQITRLIGKLPNAELCGGPSGPSERAPG